MSEEGSAESYKELWMKEQKIRLEQNEFVEMYQSAVMEREMERLKEVSAELISRDDATRKLFCGLAKLPDDAPWQDVYATLKQVKYGQQENTMSNFVCEKCGVTQFDSPTGYVAGCCHYPPHHSRFVTIDYGGGCETKAFFSGAWYKSKEAQAKHRAVHPVTWHDDVYCKCGQPASINEATGKPIGACEKCIPF
jgi:hypothetical protein